MANNYHVIDGSGANIVFVSLDTGAGIQLAQHAPSSANGAPITISNPFPVQIVTGLPPSANAIGSVTQSGVWNVTVNTGLPTGANVIGNVSVSSITLPGLTTGANNIGIVNVSSNVSQNAAFSANSPLICGGVYNASLPTINSTCASSLQVDTKGRLIVNTVTSYDIKVTSTPTINLSSYSAGYVVGGQQNLNIFRTSSQPSGILTQVWAASKGGSSATLTIYLFDSPPSGSTVADHGALALANTDLVKLVTPPFVLTPTVIGAGSTQSFGSAAFSMACQSTEGTPNTYLYLVATVGSAQTYPTTSDLVFGISLSQD